MDSSIRKKFRKFMSQILATASRILGKYPDACRKRLHVNDLQKVSGDALPGFGPMQVGCEELAKTTDSHCPAGGASRIGRSPQTSNPGSGLERAVDARGWWIDPDEDVRPGAVDGLYPGHC